MKQYLFLILVIISCREKVENHVQEPQKTDSPPRELGAFQVNVGIGSKLHSEPDLLSKILTIAPVDSLVTALGSSRIVIDPVRKSPVNIILVRHKGVTGWLDSDHLIFRREAPDKLHPFTNKVSDFKLGCLTDDPADSENVACSNCGTLDFFPWGGFQGTLGCDEHLTGKWRIVGESIIIQAESEVMCNHAFNHPPTEAECQAYQASTRKTRTITLIKNNDKWILKPDLRLTAQKTQYTLFSP